MDRLEVSSWEEKWRLGGVLMDHQRIRWVISKSVL